MLVQLSTGEWVDPEMVIAVAVDQAWNNQVVVTLCPYESGLTLRTVTSSPKEAIALRDTLAHEINEAIIGLNDPREEGDPTENWNRE